MAFLILLFVPLLLSLSLADFVSPPPAGSLTAALPIYTNNADFDTQWSSSFSRTGLVLWNNYVMSDGTQNIIRLIENASPDPGSWSGQLENIDLTQGSSFHLEVLELDDSGKETGNNINSNDFEIIPNPSATASATAAGVTSVQVETKTNVYTTFQTSYAIFTSTASAPSDVAAALASVSAVAYAQGQSDQGDALPHSAVLGLGIGLGLGIPLLIAASVAATLYFCVNAHQPIEKAESNWGTETTRHS